MLQFKVGFFNLEEQYDELKCIYINDVPRITITRKLLKFKLNITKITKCFISYTLYYNGKSYKSRRKYDHLYDLLEYPKEFLKEYSYYFNCKKKYDTELNNYNYTMVDSPLSYIDSEDCKDYLNIRSVDKISNWFLECKYNPKYKFCRDRINKMYDEEFN